MKNGLFILCFSFFTTLCFAQYDWDGIEVPAEAGNANYSWELVDKLSDDFNYETPAGSNKGDTFNEKWEDGYINPWPGFGKTTWTPNNSRVTSGNLELKATSKNADLNENYFSAAHAREQIIYPVYIETNIKIMNSVMANAVWMLSDNSKEEIDIVEAYGSSYSGSQNQAKTWFAERMHLSHHNFSAGGTDYQPTTATGTYYRLQPGGSLWRDGFHTVGVYWKDPFHLEYYIDGELVRVLHQNAIASRQESGKWNYIYYKNTNLEIVTHSTSNNYSESDLLAASNTSTLSVIDPFEHLGGNGMSKPETIIFSGAAQQWQVNGGVYPTVEELAIEEDNIFKVNWIRTYKRIDAPNSVAKINVSEKLVYANPIKDFVTIKANANLDRILFYHINGKLAKVVEGITQDQQNISLANLNQGMYIMHVIDKDGFWGSEKLIKR